MKKSNLAIKLAMTTLLLSSASLAHATSDELQSIRIFQTSTQFEQAVEDNKVVLDLGRSISLIPEVKAGTAGRLLTETLRNPGPNGVSEIKIECALALSTTSKKPRLSATTGSANKWSVSKVERLPSGAAGSLERWTLQKPGAPTLRMTCRATETVPDEVQPVGIPLTASMVDKVFANYGARLKTSISNERYFEERAPEYASQPLNEHVGDPSSRVSTAQ